MKITKFEFDSLYSPDIKKIDYDSIVSKIDTRFYEIYSTLNPSISKKGWCDYDNCDMESEESGGYFDPLTYKKYIGFNGDYSTLKAPYETSFPTRWLWEDNFHEEYIREVTAYKQNEIEEKLAAKEKVNLQKEEKKKIIAEIHKKISTVLTAKEMKYISFK